MASSVVASWITISPHLGRQYAHPIDDTRDYNVDRILPT